MLFRSDTLVKKVVNRANDFLDKVPEAILRGGAVEETGDSSTENDRKPGQKNLDQSRKFVKQDHPQEPPPPYKEKADPLPSKQPEIAPVA